jgi:hypothetical protein
VFVVIKLFIAVVVVNLEMTRDDEKRRAEAPPDTPGLSLALTASGCGNLRFPPQSPPC